MKKLLCTFCLAASSCLAADHILIQIRENDSAVLILDRENPDHQRGEVVIPPTQSPGRVIVEMKNDPDPKDWTQVRWVFRFDLSKVPPAFKQARLHLWCQGTAGDPKVQPRLEVIPSADFKQIVSVDRTSQPLIEETQDVPFPERSKMIELDVTAMVQAARKRESPYAAFRISAVCDKPDCRGNLPQNFYFGGYTNVWEWPQSEPPVLEITP